jgi:hypothetical protein
MLVRGFQPPTPDPYAQAEIGAQTLRGMYQANATGDRAAELGTMQLAETKRVAGGQKLLSDMIRQSTDAKGVINHNNVANGLNDAGYGTEAANYRATAAANQLARHKEQIEMARTMHAEVANGLGVIVNATPESKQATWTAVKQSQIRKGLIKNEDMPDIYDEAFLQAEIGQSRKIEDQIKTAQEGLKINETGRHNLAGETETTRHNKTDESTEIGKLGETGRHNRSAEVNDATVATETSRHNRKSEGIQGATLSETSRHNQATEVTARLVANVASSGAKSPESFKKTQTAVTNMRTALEAYKTALNVDGPESFLKSGGANHTMLKARFTDLQMQLKGLYELGAITGPDMEILGAAITDPTSANGNWKGKDSLLAQLSVFDEIVNRNDDNSRAINGQPPRIPAMAPTHPNTGGITVDSSKVKAGFAVGETRNHQGSTYSFDGKQWVKQ